MFGRTFRVRRRWLAVGALASVALVLAACVPEEPPPPPPPPPTDPHDVLVVGDSIAFSFGCALGDDGGSGQSCPAPGGFTTHSEIVGGCTISGGTILFYNGQTASSYGCDNWPTAWAELADRYLPKVVVIVTSGWEIMDRWSGSPAGLPDRQWGGANFGAAANAYSTNLNSAINLFLSKGAQKVVVANSVYMNPPEPQFPPGTPGAPDFLIDAWYERYPTDNTTEPPKIWAPPNGPAGLAYRPSKTKVEQFNQTIANTVSSTGNGNDLVFNFFSHFSPGGVYSNQVCPPPNDALAPPCPGDQTPINARAPDGGHLTPSPGGQDILAYYLVPCVRGLLGVTGGDVGKCS
jgi:hypothetical protein